MGGLHHSRRVGLLSTIPFTNCTIDNSKNHRKNHACQVNETMFLSPTDHVQTRVTLEPTKNNRESPRQAMLGYELAIKGSAEQRPMTGRKHSSCSKPSVHRDDTVSQWLIMASPRDACSRRCLSHTCPLIPLRPQIRSKQFNAGPPSALSNS